MHYNVLTAIALPEETAIPPEDYERIQVDLLTVRALLEKEPENYVLQMALAELENRLNPLEYMAESLVSKVMEPYGMHTANSNVLWDWYELGGRWYEYFLVKEDCSSAVRGTRARVYGPAQIAPEGYCWAAGAKKCDIAWDKMKERFVKELSQSLREFQSWCLAGEVPEKWRGTAFVTPDGVYLHRRLVYCTDKTAEENLSRANHLMEARYFVNPYAFIGRDGWMGCDNFSAASLDGTADTTWNQTVQNFIDSLPEDALLVSVDCHN